MFWCVESQLKVEGVIHNTISNNSCGRRRPWSNGGGGHGPNNPRKRAYDMGTFANMSCGHQHTLELRSIPGPVLSRQLCFLLYVYVCVCVYVCDSRLRLVRLEFLLNCTLIVLCIRAV